MFRSLKDPDQQSDLGKADRSFALAMDGQRFEDITREEAKCLRQPQPVREAVSVEKNAGLPGTAPMGAYANPRCKPTVLHLEIEFDPSSSLDELTQAAREIIRRRLAKLRSEQVVPLETD